MKKIYSLIFMVSCLLASCTKNFEEINTDPNRPKEVNPGVVLGQMQYRIVSSSISAARGFTHELMQVDAPRSSAGGGGVHRYVITPGTGVWSSFYTYLADIDVVISSAERLKENNYKAIGLVYKCWAYSILTDVYGDVPYSQAMQAANGNFQPKFDAQKDIYTQILKDLVAANDLFDDTKALTYGGDGVYNSNVLTGGKNVGIQNWKKFCNTLRLRLLLRLLKRDGELNISDQIKAILADPVKYPVFTSNTEEGIYKFPNVNPYFNPYYTARQLDWRDGTYYTKFFIDNLNAWNDPRRAVWALTVSVNGQNVYQGIESGYPTTTEYVVGKNSSYTDALKTSAITGVMITYAEEEFIKAELALRGFNTGNTAKNHYEKGITASMTQWGVALPAGYLQQTGVKYNEGSSVDTQLQQIMLQKYYAYFFNDYQAWLEKRRTGYPVLPRGSGIPAENQFPSRIPYPTYLQSLNANNLAAAVAAMGGDKSTIKVWWEK
ncbi:SusD/RagB family nutrient-binding outer membrane lipoprotein [Mucilaginibacter sp. RS28]|uniref:SusD/RagB family nutrient-binding outer membrane lipoprotein n=1 Tax=Mucilaginibacter straminoryzae TaxID=2932774 RepID=A0A9X1X5H1_9SPHI|nr:SusD/RagB family nutrient-binding outer membrane lipoprotein [Mucilaginibacter straminoryzae]MCJ8211331.1 SusD/RagB family nutrient-binding outer membrane lipoprotein [Mucilaginibacter straminoryzae]